jgi:hypothetical protein
MLLEAMCSSVLVLSQRDSVINSIACGRGSPQDIRPGGRLYTRAITKSRGHGTRRKESERSEVVPSDLRWMQ